VWLNKNIRLKKLKNMNNPFAEAARICNNIAAQEKAKHLSWIEDKPKRQAAFAAISPMIEGVLRDLHEAVYPKYEVRTEENSASSFYSCSIGYRPDSTSGKFLEVVQIIPEWQDGGVIAGLYTFLNLPKNIEIMRLASAHGVDLKNNFSDLSSKIHHTATRDALVEALRALHKPGFLAELLPILGQYKSPI
jgi:hypothetical protein